MVRSGHGPTIRRHRCAGPVSNATAPEGQQGKFSEAAYPVELGGRDGGGFRQSVSFVGAASVDMATRSDDRKPVTPPQEGFVRRLMFDMCDKDLEAGRADVSGAPKFRTFCSRFAKNRYPKLAVLAKSQPDMRRFTDAAQAAWGLTTHRTPSAEQRTAIVLIASSARVDHTSHAWHRLSATLCSQPDDSARASGCNDRAECLGISCRISVIELRAPHLSTRRLCA